MTKREKKKMVRLIVIILTIAVLICVVGAVTLYLKTDMLKSNKVLFEKYASQNFDNIEAIIDMLEIGDSLESGKYQAETEYSIKYTQNAGTTAENTNNAINKVKIELLENIDKENQYDYKNIKLLSDEELLEQVEYLQDGDKVGIKGLDIVQFLYAENSNIKELLSTLGLEELATKIPDTILDDTEKIEFTNEEIESLKSKYIGILNDTFNKDNFSKESKQRIIIDDKEIIANAYLLNASREKMNNLYLKILAELKQDEIILSKIDKLQNKLDKISFISDEEINLHDKFISLLENTVENINKNNIGSETVSIAVYEYNKQTVAVTIPGIKKEINIDCMQTGEEQVVAFNVTSGENIIKKITLNKNEQKSDIYIEDNDRTKPIKLNINKENSAEGSNTSITYEIEKIKLEAKINKNIQAVNEFENQIKFINENSRRINKLSKENLEGIVAIVKGQFEKKYAELNEKIDIVDIEDVLDSIGLKNSVAFLESTGEITESQRNRFNSKFEFLQGEELDWERTLNEIETFKENIVDFNVISGDVLKIEVDRINSQDERVDVLKEFIEGHKNMKHTVSLEYDEETGLVKYIVMTLVP